MKTFYSDWKNTVINNTKYENLDYINTKYPKSVELLTIIDNIYCIGLSSILDIINLVNKAYTDGIIKQSECKGIMIMVENEFD